MTQTNVVLSEEEAQKQRHTIFTNVVLLQEETRVIKVHLSDLISLKQIPGAEIAVRPIDEAYVQRLMRSPASTYPAIKLAPTNLGLIVVDGYLRVVAAARNNELVLDAVITSYATMMDVIDAAFRSDFTHGLQASEERRGDYAYWLHCNFKDMTQQDIANRAEITQPAVSKAIAKRLELLQEAVLDEAIKQQLATERTFKLFSHSAVRFANGLEAVNDEDALKYIQASVKKEEDLQKLARLGLLLMQVASGQEGEGNDDV